MSAHVKAVKSTAEDVATKAAQAHGMQHAATASLEGLPAEMVAVVAAHAGFFDRAKLATCSKHLSRSCATVTSEVLIVRGGPRHEVFGLPHEMYAGDGTEWRRCADCLGGDSEEVAFVGMKDKAWRIRHTIERTYGGYRLVRCGVLEAFEIKRNAWCSFADVEQLGTGAGPWCPGICAFNDRLVLVGGTTGQNNLARVLQLDPETGSVVDMARLPVPRTNPACGVCDGRLFVLGGRCGAGTEDPEEQKVVRVLEQREGQEDVWSAFATLPPKLCRKGEVGATFRPEHVVFRDHHIIIIGACIHWDYRTDPVDERTRNIITEDDFDVRVLDVRTREWTTLDTTTKAHWRLRRRKQDPYLGLEDPARAEVISTEDTIGGPEIGLWARIDESHTIDFRGDIAVFLTAEGDDPDDLDRPGIYVLSGDTWIPTGGRMGVTSSRDTVERAFSSSRETAERARNEKVEVVAPPSWLEAMPDFLAKPRLIELPPESVEGASYRSVDIMSNIYSSCTVRA